MKFGKLLALMLPLVLVMVLAVACGGAEPAAGGSCGGYNRRGVAGRNLRESRYRKACLRPMSAI